MIHAYHDQLPLHLLKPSVHLARIDSRLDQQFLSLGKGRAQLGVLGCECQDQGRRIFVHIV